MALPYSNSVRLPSLNPLFQNANPGLTIRPFLDFLNIKQTNRPMPGSQLDPMKQMGSGPNAATMGGNLISPALRAMLGEKS
jgi:hypothetical protein